MARIVMSDAVPGARILAPKPVSVPGVPLLMHDEVLVNSGAEQPFNSQAFQNMRGKPVLIHGVNMFVTSATALNVANMFNGTIALQMTIHRKGGKTVQMTRGYVPSWCLARSNNRRADAFSSGNASALAWRFTHPMQLDPEDIIEVQAKHLGSVDLPLTIALAFAGVDGSTPFKRVPYAFYWQSQDFAYGQAAVDSTPSDALTNDTGRDLNVDRIIGRFASTEVTGGNQRYADFRDVTNQATNYAALRLSLSQRRVIIRDYTPFRAVFGQNAALETPFIMPPKDYLTADVQHTAGATLVTPLTSFRGRAFISVVGWREV